MTIRLPTIIGLAVSMMLATACKLPPETEEPHQDQDGPEWTRLTAADIAERWQTLSGSSAAPPESTAARGARNLAAADTDDTLREAGFEITDPRRYGTRDVFTAHLNELAMLTFSIAWTTRRVCRATTTSPRRAASNGTGPRPTRWLGQRFISTSSWCGRASRKHPEGATVSATLGDKSFDLQWQGEATVMDPDSE